MKEMNGPYNCRITKCTQKTDFSWYNEITRQQNGAPVQSYSNNYHCLKNEINEAKEYNIHEEFDKCLFVILWENPLL
jgi:hypothetical protein